MHEFIVDFRSATADLTQEWNLTLRIHFLWQFYGKSNRFPAPFVVISMQYNKKSYRMALDKDQTKGNFRDLSKYMML